jgi:uncharacterized protein YjbI with pentapeptide repeats
MSQDELVKMFGQTTGFTPKLRSGFILITGRTLLTSKFRKYDFQEFQGRTGNRISIEGLKFPVEHRDLHGLSLQGLNMRRVTLSGGDLSRANLSEADLTGALLIRANLRGANLTDACLAGASLRAADLSKANLTRADLRKAIIRGADMRGCVLEGQNLEDLKKRGAIVD